jgi:hypothetical protein
LINKFSDANILHPFEEIFLRNLPELDLLLAQQSELEDMKNFGHPHLQMSNMIWLL